MSLSFIGKCGKSLITSNELNLDKFDIFKQCNFNVNPIASVKIREVNSTIRLDHRSFRNGAIFFYFDAKTSDMIPSIKLIRFSNFRKTIFPGTNKSRNKLRNTRPR